MKKNYLNMIIESHLYDLKQRLNKIYYNGLYPLFKLSGSHHYLYVDHDGTLGIQKPYIIDVGMEAELCNGYITIKNIETGEVLIDEVYKDNGEVNAFRFVWEATNT